ncbi:MAG TPA: DEAD/DEAH box helicase [Kofleriaceae bacterium]|jgi:superfamily II DNA or RNA helicase
MSAPQLRTYQREAIDAVIAARRAGTRRMVVCLPTGAGKTVIFSELARMARKQVLVLAHREELLGQAVDKLSRALEGTRVVGLERGTSRAPSDAKVLVASLRSLHPDRIGGVLGGRDIGLIIYDECHHAPADDNLRILRAIGAFESDWPGTLVGFTATTQRGDGKALESVFEEIVYSKTLPDLIDAGFLAPLKGYRVATEADLSRLSSRGDDFVIDELAEAVDIQERNALVARTIQELARDRRTIAFCVTVNHARNLSKALNHVGVPAGIVHGEMPSAERARALADFRQGRIAVLANVAVLTEGFDDPGVSCIAMARPTRSEGMYAQCVGRGTRLAEGKKDCLILDFVDVSELSLCTLPSLFGCPRDMDLRGEDARDAARTWEQIQLDYPELELEARALTLSEIQDRAESFDPLTLDVNPEVRAISPNAWFSLGRHGVGLLFMKKSGAVGVVTVLNRGGRGPRWVVTLGDEVMERYTTLEQGVEAVDYELAQQGPGSRASALEEAAWRRAPVPPETRAQLREPDRVHTHAEAIQLLVWGSVVGQQRRFRI